MIAISLSMSMLCGCLLWACMIGFLILRSRKKTDAARDRSDTSGPAEPSPPGGSIPTNITFFNDTSSFSGVDLSKYGKSAPSWNGHRLYPAAVHHDDAAKYLYGVFRVDGADGSGLNPIHVHIVDICNRADGPCTNRSKNGRNFLIDVHETGWNVIGATTGVLPGTARYLGQKDPNTIPTSALLQGKSTYVMCRCSGTCDKNTQQWKPAGSC